MFNLGTKTVVLNSNANVTEANGVISITGFGTFTIPTISAAAGRSGGISIAKNAVAGVYTITPVTAYDDTKTYDIVLGIRSERILSNIFSDVDLWTFQSKAGSTNIGGAFAGGQIKGFNDQIVKFSGTTTLVATFQPGYEGVSIESIEIRDVNTGVSQRYSWAITTAPSEGLGLGRHIEEEVQNSTGENLDPYGSGKGPNDTVDVRGKYTEITWSSATGEVSPGWAPHEMLGYGDVNTEARSANVMFSAYLNEASATGAIAILSKLVSGVGV
jgi:hypothetical protein